MSATSTLKYLTFPFDKDKYMLYEFNDIPFPGYERVCLILCKVADPPFLIIFSILSSILDWSEYKVECYLCPRSNEIT